MVVGGFDLTPIIITILCIWCIVLILTAVNKISKYIIHIHNTIQEDKSKTEQYKNELENICSNICNNVLHKTPEEDLSLIFSYFFKQFMQLSSPSSRKELTMTLMETICKITAFNGLTPIQLETIIHKCVEEETSRFNDETKYKIEKEIIEYIKGDIMKK